MFKHAAESRAPPLFPSARRVGLKRGMGNEEMGNGNEEMEMWK